MSYPGETSVKRSSVAESSAAGTSVAESDLGVGHALDHRERFNTEPACAQFVAAALKALFYRNGNARKACARLLYYIYKSVRRRAVSEKVVDDKHRVVFI